MNNPFSTSGHNAKVTSRRDEPGFATVRHIVSEDALDAAAGVDAMVPGIERMFDSKSSGEVATWAAGTETGSRSSTRPQTGSSSPNRQRRGPGSLGVLMPTLLPSRPTLTGRGTSDLGTLTHGLIGSHIQFVTDGEQSSDLLARMYAVAYAVIDANPNATRVLATEAASLAHRYLRDFPPLRPWRLLGVEFDTGDGPVDLAWVNDTTGEAFFDEVKTSRVSNGRQVPPTWLEQAHRYATAGAERFGEAFLGTRLVPLMAADAARLVRHRRPVVRLAPTAAEPLRFAHGNGGA